MAIYQIELTNYCNSACEWCGHSSMKREKGFMSWDIFKCSVELLKKEPPPGGVVGLHHFGESLLHPEIKGFLHYLEDRKIKWRLSTNGRLLKEKEIREMLLTTSGLLVISMENGADINFVNKLIREKSLYRSPLQILVQTFGDTDFSQLAQGEYRIFKTVKHSWAKNGNGDYRKCRFLAEDWVCILWDGTIVSCCMDMEGECVLGHVNTGRLRNHPPEFVS